MSQVIQNHPIFINISTETSQKEVISSEGPGVRRCFYHIIFLVYNESIDFPCNYFQSHCKLFWTLCNSFLHKLRRKKNRQETRKTLRILFQCQPYLQEKQQFLMWPKSYLRQFNICPIVLSFNPDSNHHFSGALKNHWLSKILPNHNGALHGCTVHLSSGSWFSSAPEKILFSRLICKTL